jgi:RND family efflux transporter MFP subunit
MYKLSFLLIPAFLLFLQSCTPGNASEQNTGTPPKKVETAPARTVDFQTVISATGRLSLEQEAKLSFKTGGIIQRIDAVEGQKVRKGQVLAVLDLQEIQARNQQAQLGQQQAAINVENARLALRLAQRDYENANGLYQDSVATLEQLQNAEVQLDNAKNQLQAAEKALSMQQEQVTVADFNLQYSRIIAPANGVILKRMAEPNEVVGPGTPVFFFGSQEKAKVIRVNLTDKDIIHVQAGDKATIHFDAYPTQTFKGRVTEIASMADPYTGTFEVEIQVDEQGEALLSGFIGSVDITTTNRQELIAIPIDALLGANGSKGEVFIIEDQKAIKTEVNIYKIADSALLLSNGLKNGQQVITSGVGYLEDQQSVYTSDIQQ